MSLTCGLLGLPNVGKSTLFNKLTNQNVPASDYPFCTINPNIGIFNIIDPNVNLISKVCKSNKVVYNNIKFIDIAGLIKGASKGSGMGNAFLSDIRRVNSIAHVIRGFGNDIDVLRDIDTINDEIILSDIGLIEKNKHLTDKDKLIINALSKGIFNHNIENEYELLTKKNIFFVINVRNKEDGDQLVKIIKSKFSLPIYVSSMIDDEIWKLGNIAMKSLDLIKFITCGEKETRAWNVRAGSTADIAAGKIHSDFRKKLIRTQIVKYDQISTMNYFDWTQQNIIKIVNKKHIIEDNDIVKFMVKK